MINILITVFAFILVLGVLITVHEFGHYLAAKRVGVRVEKFSVGFGPKLWGFTRGETEYMVSAFPVGGYVKLTGENPDEELEGAPWEFPSRTVRERMKIIFWGPLMNMALACIFMVIVFLLGRHIPKYLANKPVVGWIAEDSIGSELGLKPGDMIKSINGKPMLTWEEFYTEIAGNPDGDLAVLWESDGRNKKGSFTPKDLQALDMGSLGIAPPMPPRVGGLSPGFPAEKAGLEIGDLITHIDGEPISHWLDLSGIIHQSIGKTLELTIKRKPIKSLLRNQPVVKIKIIPTEAPEGIGLIGIQPPRNVVLRRYSLTESTIRGLKEVYKLATVNLLFLGRVFSGNASMKSIGGPIMIAQVAGSAAKAGLSDLLYFMGFLSLQLGILNLFPIPVLDGGHILFLTFEAILRKPVNMKIKELSQQVGVALILLLMLVAFYNDIVRFFMG